MKNFFLNLSVRSKLILGFIVIILILLFNGIKSYNVVKSLDNKNNEIINTTSISFQLKETKYMVMAEMQKLNELIFSEANKEFEKVFEEHSKIDAELKQAFDTIATITKIVGDDDKTREFKIQVHDTILAVKALYQKAFSISFNEVKKIKKELINPTYLGEDVILIMQDTIQTQDSIPINDTTFASLTNQKRVTKSMQRKFAIYERQLREHNKFVDRNGMEIISKLDGLETLSSSFLLNLKKESESVSESSFNQTFLTIFFGLIVSILLSWFISSLITRPLYKLRNLMYQLAIGELPKHILVELQDEIGNMSNALNQLVDGLKRTSDFAFEIGKGNFTSEFEPLSDKDVLGNSLIDMRKSLQVAKEEEEKRKVEDIQRNWATEGLAKFAEILRHHTENIKELSNDIVKNLVKYLKANQGGIFIYNDSNPDDIHLELLAVYAYNRKKYLEKKIYIGEGLIGAVALEKYTIYMTDVPNEYIEIESGIGSSNPKSILIVPLKIENNILGVIELASFTEFHKHEIELVEKIAESIAATLSTARITTRTAELLEQSKIQAQEMQEKEEELLHNIEALKTTQEESAVREEYLKRSVKELETYNLSLAQKEVLLERELEKLKSGSDSKTKELTEKVSQLKVILETSQDGVITIDEKGSIEYFNHSAQEIWGYKEQEIIGRNIKLLFSGNQNKDIETYIVEYLSNIKGKDKGKEMKIIKKDSSEGIILASICETKLEGEQQYTLFVTDLSSIKALEADKNRLIENLMMKEFDFTVRIEELENKLKGSNIALPTKDDDSDLLRWEDGYSINLNTIDQQHKKWIDIINRLYRAYRSGSTLPNLSGYFTELTEYTDYHFGFEEKYLEDFKTEGYKEHMQEHDRFSRKLNEFKQEFLAGKIDVTYKLMIYLKNWVKNHITKVDIKYVDTFKRNGLQ